MLLVVRHADAGDKARWNGPDGLRPLSPVGRLQAEGLVIHLEDYPVERILCSPTRRCHQTVQPLARDRLLEIEPVAALGVDAGFAEVMALFWDRGWAMRCCAPMARCSGCYSGSWRPMGWRPRHRWTGPRARPGCWSGPASDRSTPTFWPRWPSAAA